MTSIDLYGAYAISGLGSLVGALMVGIARTDSVELRDTLFSCFWAFLILGLGMGQFAFAPAGAPWSVMVGAQSALIGTALFAWGFARLAGHRIRRRSLFLAIPLLSGALVAAGWFGGVAYPLAFHGLCFAVALVMATASRNYLLRPRNAAERAVGFTMAFYATTWTFGIASTLHYGPMHAHLMNMKEPLLSLYAATYALMPMVVGSLVLNLVNAQLREQVRELAETDELTGLLARRGMKSRYPQWRISSDAAPGEAWALLIDIDKFKTVNDLCGHDVGDRVLQHIAQLLRRSVGREALVSRHGGEEFLLLLWALDEADCQAQAERIRGHIEGSPFCREEGLLRVTVSIGLAMFPDGTALANAIKKADRALYEAKAAGRNRVASGAR